MLVITSSNVRSIILVLCLHLRLFIALKYLLKSLEGKPASKKCSQE